jgi:hypothetical protein
MRKAAKVDKINAASGELFEYLKKSPDCYPGKGSSQRLVIKVKNRYFNEISERRSLLKKWGYMLKND